MVKNTNTTATLVSHKDDLKKAYLFIFDEFATDPTDFAAKTSGVNQRFARELFATLVDQQLVVETDTGDGAAWEVTDPGNQHDVTREEAESRFDEVINPTATTEGAKAPKPKKAKSLSDCLCGCGEQSQNNYRPGHDARHAGQIGREIAAGHGTKGFNRRTLLEFLPTDALKAKAEGVAETAIQKEAKREAAAAAKAAAKQAKEDAKSWTEGTAKVGKEELPARKQGETVEVMKDGEWVAASKTAAKSFTE